MSEALMIEKKHSILDAAQKRFAHYGLNKVTMDEIAQDLGMAKASLYYYFPTKESIFKAVIAREQEKFIVLIRTLLEKPLSAAAKIKQYAEYRLVYLRELLNLNSLTSTFYYQNKPLFEDLYQSFAQQELTFFTQIISAGQQSGEFSVTDCQKTAATILNVFRGLRFVYLKRYEGLEFNTTGYNQLIQEMSFLIDLILNGLNAPTSPIQ